MKKVIISTLVCVALCFAVVLSGCKDDDPVENNKGILQLKAVNTIEFKTKKEGKTNPILLGDTTETQTTSFMVCIGDIWVSKGEVKNGGVDDMEWISLTGTTNLDIKRFEEYNFAAVEIDAGEYKSIKVSIRNLFYRYAQLSSDPSVVYELMETNGSWTDPCDPNDTSWSKTNYFGPDGLHYLKDDNTFELVQPKEKIAGFTIQPNRKAIVSWRLGAGKTEPCITYLIDENGNRKWDCGIDRMDFKCPPDVDSMFDFLVEYE